YRSANEKDVIWPSFNVLAFDGARVGIDTVYFPPSHDPDKDIVRQSILSVDRQNASWHVAPVPQPPPANSDIDADEATFTLSAGGVGYWSFDCVREVTSGAAFDAYRERVEVTDRADLEGTV